MFAPDFLDGFDRLVAFDAETTGKRTPDSDFIKKQPFAWKPPGIVIEVGFVEMRREGAAWTKTRTWRSLVNPDGPIDPAAIAIHKIKPGDLKNAPRFPQIQQELQDFIGERAHCRPRLQERARFPELRIRPREKSSAGARAPMPMSVSSARKGFTRNSSPAPASR